MLCYPEFFSLLKYFMTFTGFALDKNELLQGAVPLCNMIKLVRPYMVIQLKTVLLKKIIYSR